MSSGIDIHITYTDTPWIVTRDGKPGPLARCATLAEAREYAERWAPSYGGEIVTHPGVAAVQEEPDRSIEANFYGTHWGRVLFKDDTAVEGPVTSLTEAGVTLKAWDVSTVFIPWSEVKATEGFEPGAWPAALGEEPEK